MDHRLPLWFRDHPERYIYDNTQTSKSFVSMVFADLGWPRIDRPPDECRPGGYYGGSWTWIWYLGPEKSTTSTFMYCRMDIVGRAELWFHPGDISPGLSAVACRWGCGHKFKYGYFKFDDIKNIWESIVDKDAQKLVTIIPNLKLQYYQRLHSRL